MTDLMPTPGAALEADPVQYMAVILHRAKCWLEEAQSVDEVRNAKAIAVGYESVIREKELASDALLSASELVRRCERRVGELLKEQSRRPGRPRSGESAPVGANFSGGHERADVSTLAGADPKRFDQAVDQARQEGNLSRANVVRKIRSKGKAKDTPRQRELNAVAVWDSFMPLHHRLISQLERLALCWDDLPESLKNMNWATVKVRMMDAYDAVPAVAAGECTEVPVADGLRRVK